MQDPVSKAILALYLKHVKSQTSYSGVLKIKFLKTPLDLKSATNNPQTSQTAKRSLQTTLDASQKKMGELSAHNENTRLRFSHAVSLALGENTHDRSSKGNT